MFFLGKYFFRITTVVPIHRLPVDRYRNTEVVTWATSDNREIQTILLIEVNVCKHCKRQQPTLSLENENNYYYGFFFFYFIKVSLILSHRNLIRNNFLTLEILYDSLYDTNKWLQYFYSYVNNVLTDITYLPKKRTEERKTTN